MKRFHLLRTWALTTTAAFIATSLATVTLAGSIGVNFQNDFFAFGPYSVSSETPPSAFGGAAGDWFEPGALVSSLDPTVFNPASGGSATISFSSAGTWNAYGWSHANEPVNSGDPQSGEEAVLSGFLYAFSDTETGGNGAVPIVVTISGLNSIAPSGYIIKVMASSDLTYTQYTPALASDGTTMELIDLTSGILAYHPQWNGGLLSTGAVASSTSVFSGDTLTVTLDGPNEFGSGTGRTALAGVLILAVPEPGMLPLAGLALMIVLSATGSSRRQ